MITPHYGYLNRGAETFTTNIVNELLKRNHHVDIYGMGQGKYVKHIPGVKIDKGIGKIWKNIITKTQIEAICKKYIGIEPSLSHYSYYLSLTHRFENNSYDILWNNGEIFGELFCYNTRKKYNIPFLSTFHGNESMMMITEAWLKPDLYSVLTPQYKQYLKNKVKGNIKCIPNGVDLEKYKKTVPLKKYGLDRLEHPIYLSTSALTSKKRVELVIRAISKLKTGSFVFTSDGPEKQKLLDLCKKYLKDRHIYTGIVPFDELPKLYSSCDVYVNASRSEGHSLAILEAMACDLPVVSHQDENRRFTIEKAGYLTDVTDINKFSSTLKKAGLTKWQDRPRKQAEKFSWKKTVDSYEKEIQKILNKK